MDLASKIKGELSINKTVSLEPNLDFRKNQKKSIAKSFEKDDIFDE